ncbi:hypothetical protein EBT25_10610 [bacterium]|nr:hypothetical protein [bacterium]
MESQKLIESIGRYRQRIIDLKESRRRIVVLESVPMSAATPNAQQASVTKKKTAASASTGPLCKARTLEGRQCPFKASSGGCFCKKHSTMV